MGRGRRHNERLFVYCDTRPLALRYKIGEYICAAPPHITFAKIYTDEPEYVYRTFDAVARQYEPIMIARDGIMMVGQRKRRGAARLVDVSGELERMQEDLFDRLDDRELTLMNPHQRIRDGFVPHATFDYPDRDAPIIPASFFVDTITLARTLDTPYGAGVHHRNIVTHITTLGHAGR